MPPKTATKGAAKKKAAAKKKVHFDAEDIEVNKKSGIVSGKKKQPTAKRPREEEEEEDVLESSDDEEEVSIHSSDADLSDEEEAALAPAEGAKGAKHYAVLRLRFLPPEFQEPQLFKFLGQFGATVVNCFCVRSRRTHQSKGIAYVQFDREDVLPLVKEECHGMSLGGRAVVATITSLTRPMPSKEAVARKRGLAYAYLTRGAPLHRYDMTRKKPIVILMKAAENEKENNAYLKKIGIHFSTDMFISQLKQVPKELLKKPKTSTPDEAKEASAPVETAVTPSKSKKKTGPATSATSPAPVTPSPNKRRKTEEKASTTPLPSAPPPTPATKKKASRSPSSASKTKK